MWLIILLLLSVVFIIYTTARLNWHPFLSLLITAIGYGGLSGTMTLEEVVSSINTGFGNTVGFIGIVIIAGSIIGKFLEKSGGALALADGTLKIVGKSHVPLALSIIGYIISIPVFCDSGFIIIAPLAKAMTKQAKISFAAGAMALSLGLIVTHSLVPPTPGPVGAAAILNAELGLVILLALPVSIIGMLSGLFFATRIASRINIDPHPGSEEREPASADRPSLVKAVLPIFVPIILIILRSISVLPSKPFGTATFASLINFIGQPVIALFIGILFSFLLPRRLTREMISPAGWMGEAIVGAASIIIITGCGGAFGQVLQNAGIGSFIKDHLSGAAYLSILLPIVIAASLKSAQGSGTVAVITGASLVSPLLGSLAMDSAAGRALVVVALGAGGMIASHANDSYFWVVTQISNMSVNQGYRLQTLGTLTVGITASIAVLIMSMIIL